MQDITNNKYAMYNFDSIISYFLSIVQFTGPGGHCAGTEVKHSSKKHPTRWRLLLADAPDGDCRSAGSWKCG